MVTASAPRPTCSDVVLPLLRCAASRAEPAAGPAAVKAATSATAPVAINRFVAIRSDDKAQHLRGRPSLAPTIGSVNSMPKS